MSDQPGTTERPECPWPKQYYDRGECCAQWPCVHGSNPRSSKRQAPLDLEHNDIVERVAVAIEETMFAPHEFPLDRELHAKYRHTAREAIAVVRQWDAGK